MGYGIRTSPPPQRRCASASHTKARICATASASHYASLDLGIKNLRYCGDCDARDNTLKRLCFEPQFNNKNLRLARFERATYPLKGECSTC